MEILRQEVLQIPNPGYTTKIELVNETTISGLYRLAQQSETPVAVLNFASARNPGGGFLKGSQAQEESLARSSALYSSLQRFSEFYDRHRNSNSLLYSDSMIVSPACPFFRTDDGLLLESPVQGGVITSPAPNRGAIRSNRPEELPFVAEVLQRRSQSILAVAAKHGYRRLILGAWGCGVFQNDPQVVARCFKQGLAHSDWAGRFEQVLFSVYDTSASGEIHRAFEHCFA